VSDYDKGVCTPLVMATCIAAAREKGIRVIADPIRGSDYRKYHGCSAVTPNRLEAGLATGRTIQTLPEAHAAAEALREQLDLEAAVVTLDKDGMVVAHRDGWVKTFPTRPRHVYDITGAGDMVMSVLGLALAGGSDFENAVRLANIAGGLEVEKIGVATVTREEIMSDLVHSPNRSGDPMPGSHKVRTVPQLLGELEMRRANGQRIAFTNGCFDVLHAGHVQYLHESRSTADVLVVGLNSDASVRKLKGQERPINTVDARAVVLAGLQCVDYVTIFGDDTPLSLIEAVRAEVLVKGADYRKDEVVGASFVESYGGRVHLAEMRDGFSTTELVRKLRAA